MKIYLFDSTEIHQNLLPLSYTRPVADFRCGILTIREKWEFLLNGDYSYFPVTYLRARFGSIRNPDEEALFIAGNLLPREDLIDFILKMQNCQAIQKNGFTLIFKGSYNQFSAKEWTPVPYPGELATIDYVFDIFLQNPNEIKLDFKRLTKSRKSQPLPDCVRTIGSDSPDHPDIFIEEGASVECATINTKSGPVFIGKNCSVMEGACIRGPFALLGTSEVKMGAKIYEGTTIGPHCKVGGEISNTVFFGYSNKAHDGYLGNAVIGQWCNIGAGTNASNLKNDYSLIRLWNYRTRSFMRTDLQFCGLIMGDHSKIGVNCMLNTATVIGVGVNLHGSGFPRNFLPCFCEGSPATGFSQVPLKKFLNVVDRVMSRRDKSPSPSDLSLLKYIYDNA